MAKKLPIRPAVILGLVRELRASALDDRPLVVAGAPSLAPLLAKELRAGGEPGAALENGPIERALALVYVLPGEPTEDDVRALRAADGTGVPIVCVTRPGVERVPYVLATDIVSVGAGSTFPVDEITAAVARRVGEAGSGLAKRLPVFRKAVCDELIRRFSLRAGWIGAVTIVPGVDLPVLTLLQIRLVLRIAHAYGYELDRERAIEVAGVVGAGFGFRTVARELLDLVPIAGWALKGTVAYAGTRAIGEAAVRYFEARSEESVRSRT
jgi:uncharacterized protein (DUF697 family)